VGFRRYTGLDLIRFRKFANELPELGNMELIKRYNLKHPEKTAKEQLTNLAIGLGLDDLHRKITGKEIPEGERWEDAETSESALPISDVVLSEAELLCSCGKPSDSPLCFDCFCKDLERDGAQ
jgi:hypothetical protein